MSGVRPGKVLEITSHGNPRIKAIRSLTQAKHRKETGLFIAEGLKLVTDALSQSWPIRAFVHEAKAIGEQPVANAAAAARAKGADVLAVSADILGKITRRDNPLTVLGIFEQRYADAARMAQTAGIVVALERIKDPGNLGTIIRTIDGVGADGVILVGSTVDPFSIEAVRATMGSLFHVPLARMSEEAFVDYCAAWSGQVVGTHLSGDTDYRTVKADRPTLLVMGNEQSGLTDELAAACQTLVRIPMAGEADSLNLAVATAVMLYELCRNRL